MPKRNGTLAALGLNVRKAREAKALTQEKLAERADLDPTYISGIERGLRNPGIKNVARLAKALGLTTANSAKGWTREREAQGARVSRPAATPGTTNGSGECLRASGFRARCGSREPRSNSSRRPAALPHCILSLAPRRGEGRGEG
jgi:DNA-binding XRE family transcriptional regulator